MKKINSMGSEVAEGFKCKPEIFDKNKPVMFSAVQIFVCDGKRCKEGQTENLAEKVRNIVRELGFDKGTNRVKITRTHCNGACRFKNFAYAYKNVQTENFNPDTAYSAWKKVHEWTEEQWEVLILSLVMGNNPNSLSDFKVEDKVYEDYEKHSHPVT